jgi:signal peptidase I
VAAGYASRVIDEQNEQNEQTRRRGSFWRELPVLLVVAIVVAVLVRAFVLQTFYIPSESMEHTLNINDRVLVNKLVYNFRDPHRGEIIVFQAPATWRNGENDEDFIKRVIGVPGDRIACCDTQQRLMINGYAIDEPYIFHDDDGAVDLASEQPFDIVVPAGRLWMMGDHRSHSSDSRERYIRTHDLAGSTIPVDAVVGRAFVVFWPLNRAGWLTVPKSFDKVPGPPKT